MKKFLPLILLFINASAIQAQPIVLKAKSLIDGTGKTINHPIVIIEDKKITAMIPDFVNVNELFIYIKRGKSQKLNKFKKINFTLNI